MSVQMTGKVGVWFGTDWPNELNITWLRYVEKDLSCPCPHLFKTEGRASKLNSDLEKITN